MALTDRVTARYSNQRMVELTNPNVAGAIAIDALRLAAAAADAEGDFLRLVGIAYDDAKAAHVGPAVRRTHAILVDYMDPASAFAKELMAESEQELLNLRDRLGAGVRSGIVTDSLLTPSKPDTSSGKPVRPDFDQIQVGDLLPGGTPRNPNS